MTVEFAPAGEVTQSVAIVVTGDVNGDSAVTLTDMVQIRAHLLSRKELKGAYLEAADLNGDGNVTLTDFVQSLSAVLGRSTIQPN
jgi:Ca2+-binding EF-hand superfamily protein